MVRTLRSPTWNLWDLSDASVNAIGSCGKGIQAMADKQPAAADTSQVTHMNPQIERDRQMIVNAR
jgi:hypothetical protein